MEYYDAHAYAYAAMLEEQAAIAAAGSVARAGCGYGVHAGSGDNGAGAIMPAGHGACGGNMHPLTLSMSFGSQSSCVTMQQAPTVGNAYGGEYVEHTIAVSKKRGAGQSKQPVAHRKYIDTFGQLTSLYRGSPGIGGQGGMRRISGTNSCLKEGQTRKGRQGGYDMEEQVGPDRLQNWLA